MPRPADPDRRTAIVDEAIRHAADVGFAHFSIRSLAETIGQSTRVVTHHFSSKAELTWAILQRLDQREHEALRSDPAWNDPAVPVSDLIRAAWDRSLDPTELPYTRLIHEIEGLGAAERTPEPIPGFLGGRATFVAECLHARGTDVETSLRLATVLNAAYTGLQLDYLTTGDTARTTGALEQLCSWSDSTVESGQ